MSIGFFAILDDISILLDDIATMSKVAVKKTTGILADDLAVNAEKASGFAAKRELPVLWAITKGSFLNKLIILPLVFILNFLLPEAITILLIIGGIYLAFEGAEKVLEWLKIVKHNDHHVIHEIKNINDKNFEEKILKEEKVKIKSAIMTDFVLSLEIVIIALSTVIQYDLITQMVVTSLVAFAATIGVYGFVAFLVRLDDIGFFLQKEADDKQEFTYKLGGILIKSLPIAIKSLAYIGTIAMLLVAGGIFIHNIEFFHHYVENINLWILPDLLLGFIIGLITFIIINSILFIKNKVLK